MRFFRETIYNHKAELFTCIKDCPYNPRKLYCFSIDFKIFMVDCYKSEKIFYI